ncbi:unnamed protein product [Effrenium voratum]|nr:unnamed protein product [Effrenium voratum]
MAAPCGLRLAAWVTCAAACNWCYLRSCLVDFEQDFCLATCNSPSVADGIDWQSSQHMLQEAVGVWPSLTTDSAEYPQWHGLLTDCVQNAQTCEGAALTAELLLRAPKDDPERSAKEEYSSWAARWFLSLPDPSVLVLAGWHVFFVALQSALGTCQEAPDHPALTLLRLASEASETFGWRRAVRQRLVKDQLRRGFELLKAVPGACVVQRAVQMVQGLARDGLTLKTAVGVCVVGQPRALLRWPEPLLSQLFQALCPLPRMRILFVLATQPSLGLHSEAAEPLEAALQTALQHARCGERMLPAELSLDLHDDLEDEEIQGLVDAYPAEAWWHQEGFGRTKWVRQLQSLARCHQLVDGDSDGLEWMLILRPDLLHIVPVPAVSRWVQPDGGFRGASRGVVLAHSGRSNVSPQAGYLEGLDRAMVLGRSAADAVLRRPLEVLSNGSWVAAHPSCLSCPAWRSPGVKLGPEKHLANVLYDAAVELMLEETWIQPLVLSERGCVNFRPCEGASCKSRDALPRWARRLVLDHTCWPASDPLAAEAWVQAAEGPGEVSGPAAAFLPEIFPRRAWRLSPSILSLGNFQARLHQTLATGTLTSTTC